MPTLDTAQADDAGWFTIASVPRRSDAIVDLWGQCYDLADRDSDRMVPTYGFRIPAAKWFDGQWCDTDGNPHEVIEDWKSDTLQITHWRWPPKPPVAFPEVFYGT